MNRRALRAAVMGVLLLSPVALTACSAGQVAQTAEQHRDNTGNMANVGPLALREVQLPYPTGGVYKAGTDARLLGAVVNSAPSDDTLVSIKGDAFHSVQVVDPKATSAAAGPTGTGSLNLTVPAGGTLFIGDGTGPSVTLVGLADDLGVGQSIDVTFTFKQAGPVDLKVPVATSARDLPRGNAYNFEPGQSG